MIAAGGVSDGGTGGVLLGGEGLKRVEDCLRVLLGGLLL
jgi:hypothetical protein